MKVLVTGSAGFIDSALSIRLWGILQFGIRSIKKHE